MSSDPAVNAAQRAWSYTAPCKKTGSFDICAANPCAANAMTAAAREALEPLREKFQQLSEAVLYIDDGTSEGMQAILDAFAPLLYSAEELR